MQQRYDKRTAAFDIGYHASKAALWDNIGCQGKPVMTRDGGCQMPSVIYFESPDHHIAGEQAKAYQVINREQTAFHFKMDMGKKEDSFRVFEKNYSPLALTKILIEELRQDMEELLDHERVTNAVLTVPVVYSSQAREMMKRAGAQAMWGEDTKEDTKKKTETPEEEEKTPSRDVIEILDEPVAAHYYYATQTDLRGQVALVLDVGGWTTDVAAILEEDEKIVELAIDGEEVGGEDFTNALLLDIKNTCLPGRKDFFPEDEQELVNNCEQAKVSLSRREKVKLPVRTDEGRILKEITRTHFEFITRPLLDRIGAVILSVLHDLSEKGYKRVDRILLVGEASKMPQIRALLEKMFPQTEILAKDQGEAVALGAAIYAKLLTDDASQVKTVTQEFLPNKRVRVSNSSFGIAALQGEYGERMVFHLIFRSDRLPMNRKKLFFTKIDGQESVRLCVYETKTNARFTELYPECQIGECVLKLPENLPKKTPIEVEMTLKEDGNLLFTGKVRGSDQQVQAVFERKGVAECLK